ncbi:histone-lysine n-methyltransferase suvr2 [Phtheirospermum japonicum]|uniref:Histone-lysine n-methyltransferase suvr2 n=1 Tax=Phtheirospermum japonicum TaxID=374723 RepID=A0A830BE31_9LAMI|nr:histone-lysine n-methyltransferase suvr2 [Phtheirospermum japonicum]
MSNKETKAKVSNAVRAMEVIGISKDKVKPVLKDLLKLFDKNWDYIEAENYRALADAIFERAEAEVVNCSTKKNVDSDAADHSKKIVHNENKDYMDEEAQAAEEELDRPLKRLRRKYQDGQGSSLNAPESSVPKMPLIMPKEEPNYLPETRLPNPSDRKHKSVQPANEGCDLSQPSRSPSHPTSLRDRGKGFVSPQTTSSMEKSPVPETEPNFESSDILTPKRNSVVASHASKDELITYEEALLAVPIAVIHSDTSNVGNSLSKRGIVTEHESSVSLSVSENDITNGTASNEPRTNAELAMVTGQGSNLEIASLPFGEVKISLSRDLALGRPDFRIPSCEAVLRLFEEKCLRSYKILDPKFSVMNLMKDMCQSFLELGSDSSSEPPAAMNIVPAIDFLNKSSATGSCLGGSHPKEMDGGDEHPETNLEKEENCAEDMNLSLMVYEQPNVTPETINSMQDVFDIANGQENVIITLVNEVNVEGPPSFYYLPKNAVFQNAHVNFTLARIGKKSCCPACSGDCLSSSEPCACARESGGEFAYTSGGLVKEDFLEECISMNRDPKEHGQFFCKVCPQERAKGADYIEPCKGHTMRKFIKECWWKCGCDIQCGNRVVQRGISFNLQVFMTAEGKGWGLRTLVDLPKGAFVCEYVGEILTNSELYDRVLRCPKGVKHSYPVILDAGWGAEGVPKDEKALCLDAAYHGNVGRFINHRCYDSNLVEIPVEVETPDHHYYHLAFFTNRKVNAMEELTWDYGIDFDDHDHPFKAFHCQCGSKFCRNIKPSSNF